MVEGLPTVVHWLYSLVSLMHSRTLMEMTSLADMHPFVGAEILLMLWFLLRGCSFFISFRKVSIFLSHLRIVPIPVSKMA